MIRFAPFATQSFGLLTSRSTAHRDAPLPMTCSESRRTRQLFEPPKPNEFESADAGQRVDWCGVSQTKFRSQSGISLAEIGVLWEHAAMNARGP